MKSGSSDAEKGFQTSDMPSKMLNTRKASQIPTTPARSPSGQTKRRPKSHSSQASSEQIEYIEHLESELSSLHAKIDALNSPTALRVQSMRVRGLKTQVRLLEYEVAQWERKAEEMVADEVHHRRMIEVGLQIKMRKLEEEGKLKDLKLKESERELEVASVKMKAVRSLEFTNRSLERRIDVLTELLAHSPTRLEFQAIGSSSLLERQNSIIQRSPRTRSVISRTLSSPSESKRRVACASEIGPSACLAEHPHDEAFSPIKDGKFVTTERDHTRSNASNSSQSEPDDQTSFQSSSTRPTSMNSSSSCNPEDESGSVTRSRKMRRFASGSCSLKPLVLPTAAVLPCLPTSAPVPERRPEKRHTLPPELTLTSLDPTPAFSLRDGRISQLSTPVQMSRRRSVSLAQKQALDALEGRSLLGLGCKDIHIGTPQESPDNHPPSATLENTKTFRDETLSPLNVRRRSLQEELEEIHEFFGSPDVTEKSPRSETSDDNGCSSLGVPTPCRSESSLAVNDATLAHVSTSLSIGKFDTLTRLVYAAKRDPWALGRRIIQNTWKRASSKLAGLTWWLLGVLFGSHGWKRIQKANPKIDEEEIARKVCCHYAVAPTNRVVAFGHRRISPVHVGAYPNQSASRQSLRLWLRFSLAIVLAVGIAIKEGPGRLMADDSSQHVGVVVQQSEPANETGDDGQGTES